MAGLENRARTAKAKWDNIVKKTQEVSIKAGTGVLSPSDIKSLGNAIRMQSDLASTLFDKAVERSNQKAEALRPEIIEQIEKANVAATDEAITRVTEKVAGLLLQKELPALLEKMQKAVGDRIESPLLQSVAHDVKQIKKDTNPKDQRRALDKVADVATRNVEKKLKQTTPTKSVASSKPTSIQYQPNLPKNLASNPLLANAMFDVKRVAQYSNALASDKTAKLVERKVKESQIASAVAKRANAGLWDKFVSWRTDIYNKDVSTYNTLHAKDKDFKAKEYRQKWYKSDNAPSLKAHLTNKLVDAVSDKTQSALLNTALRFAKVRQSLTLASYKLRFETWNTLKKGASKVWNKTKQIASSVKDLLLDPSTLLTLITGGTALINVVSGLAGSLDWKSMLWDSFKAIIPSSVVDFFSSVAGKFKEIFGDDGKKEKEEKEEKVTKENLNAYIASQETPFEQMGDTYGVEDLAAKGEALIAKRKAEEAAAEKRYKERLASAKADAELGEKMRKENGGVIHLRGKEGAALTGPYLLSETPDWDNKRWADAQAKAEADYQKGLIEAKKAYLAKGYIVPNEILKKQLANGFQTGAKGINTDIIPKGAIKADAIRGTQVWKSAGLDKLEAEIAKERAAAKVDAPTSQREANAVSNAKADSERTLSRKESQAKATSKKAKKVGRLGAEGLRRSMYGDENTFRAKDIDNWKRAILLSFRSDITGPDKAVNALYQKAIADRKARWEAWKKQGGKGVFKKPRDDFFAIHLLGRGTTPVSEYMEQHNIKATYKSESKEKPEVSGAVAKAKADTSKNGAKTIGQTLSKPASGAVARPVTASSSKMAKQGKGGVGDMLNLNNTNANGARGDASLALLNAKTL